MEDYTQKEIDEAMEQIATMEHYEMCRLWRFAPKGSDIYFNSNLPTSESFKNRLFQHFGGFNSEISKKLGWNNNKN